MRYWKMFREMLMTKRTHSRRPRVDSNDNDCDEETTDIDVCNRIDASLDLIPSLNCSPNWMIYAWMIRTFLILLGNWYRIFPNRTLCKQQTRVVVIGHANKMFAPRKNLFLNWTVFHGRSIWTTFNAQIYSLKFGESSGPTRKHGISNFSKLKVAGRKG